MDEEEIAGVVERELSRSDVAHGIEHARAVVRNAKWILDDPAFPRDVDRNVTIAAAWLHDVRSRAEDDFAGASERSATAADALLAPLGFDAQQRRRVAECIVTASWEHHLTGGPPGSPEAAVLRDADWLEAMGAVGIARVFAFAGTFGVPLRFVAGDPVHPERLATSDAAADPSPFHHFYSKLLWLRDGLTTPRGKAEGALRHDVLVEFLQEFEREVARTRRTEG